MGKRKCIFSNSLESEFPFIKKACFKGATSSDVHCKICQSDFFIANKGRTQIKNHITSLKHTKCSSSASSSSKVSKYCTNLTPGSKELELAAQEGLLAYHTLKHGHSFRSMDCTSKILKDIHDKIFVRKD